MASKTGIGWAAATSGLSRFAARGARERRDAGEPPAVLTADATGPRAATLGRGLLAAGEAGSFLLGGQLERYFAS